MNSELKRNASDWVINNTGYQPSDEGHNPRVEIYLASSARGLRRRRKNPKNALGLRRGSMKDVTAHILSALCSKTTRREVGKMDSGYKWSLSFSISATLRWLPKFIADTESNFVFLSVEWLPFGLFVMWRRK